jgi:hypothetical protein
MSKSVRPGTEVHPSSTPAVSTLLCYAEGQPTAEERGAVEDCLNSLTQRTDWLVQTPELVNEGTAEDWTLGFLLRVPIPSTDRSVESAALADVEAVVQSMEEVSGTCGIEFGLELDGRSVGWVAGGLRDQLLIDGLLQPWRDHLDQMPDA